MSLINIFLLVIALGVTNLWDPIYIYIYIKERICVGCKAITCNMFLLYCKFHLCLKTKRKNLTLGHSSSSICASKIKNKKISSLVNSPSFICTPKKKIKIKCNLGFQCKLHLHLEKKGKKSNPSK